MSKKVVYTGAFRFPNGDAASQRVLNNAKIFKDLGCTVEFISWGGSPREEDKQEDGKYSVNGFEYVITGELDSSGSFLHRIMAKYIRGAKSMKLLHQMKQKPDLIILYNANERWARKMLKFCSLYNIKLANDITEWYDNKEIHLPDILPNYINMTITQRRIKNKIVISSFLDEFYSESNNLLLPPLCDPTESKWNKSVKDIRIKPFDGVTLIYAGNPARKDCLHTVIQAVNQLSFEGAKIRFLILGITREIYLNRYADLLQTQNLHESILFLGYVSQDIIPAYYKKADFMVLLREPSRKSMAGFPTKFAESMTAGVPVIANITSDIGKYIVNGKSGYVVGGYSYDDIMSTLKTQILPLDRTEINSMKEYTLLSNKVFDYKHYSRMVESFIKQLQ